MDVRRVVEIWNPATNRAGTGYVVADALVLTAFHNVAGAGDPEVRPLGGSWASAELLWPERPPDLDHEPQADAALLRITGDAWASVVGEPVRWGRLDVSALSATESRLPCRAVGFPRSEVRGKARDTKEISGHVENLTGLKSGLITVYVDEVAAPSHPLGPSDRGGASRWSGASGAALFSRNHLVGVVVEDRARDYPANQLRAVPVASLVARPGFAMVMKAAGAEVMPADITATGAATRTTAYDVDVPAGLNNLPEVPSATFVGRGRVLAELAEALSTGSRTITQAIQGLGGIGKTTLALHYARLHASSYTVVWWLRADSPELIAAGLAALTRRLRGGSPGDLATEEAVDWAMGWLQTHPGWLLIFDNAERPKDVHDVTGQLAGVGRHLITTRLRGGWTAQSLALDVLEPDASLELLTGLTRTSAVDHVRALADDLGHLPLALEQAGAYIARTGLSIAEYRELLVRRPGDMTDRTAGDASRTVARVWRITLDALYEIDPRSVALLRIAAWYASTDIPRSLFVRLFDDLLDLVECLALLADYHMISPTSETFSVHRLVQTVSRTPSPDDPHRSTGGVESARHVATALLWRALPADARGNTAGWPVWDELLPHAEALLAATAPVHDTKTIDLILTTTAQYLNAQGQSRPANAYFARSLEATVRLWGDDHPETLRARNNLAGSYLMLEDTGRAISLHERTLDDRLRVLGENDVNTLASMDNLAAAYVRAGDAPRALLLLERAHAGLVRVAGEHASDTLKTQANIAAVHHEAGAPERSVELLERVLPRYEEALGADHPDVLTARRNLAVSYLHDGRLVRGAALLEKWVADVVRVMGDGHPRAVDACEELQTLHEVLKESGYDGRGRTAEPGPGVSPAGPPEAQAPSRERRAPSSLL
ncbi:tetratricopeptide repeat protein [Streptomyces anulatus]|uniref:tetratricopeptide repeat protein n=1 Tax=Streptomyces anulatus TaxID=1892 RepID=UPI0036C43204